MAENLKPIYAIVARELALGIDLKDICDTRGLKYESMQRVARGGLFQQEVKKFQAEIDQEMLNHAVADPILVKLKALSYRAVGTLATEMENYDLEAGGSPTTRISASKAILDKAGYSGKGEGATIGNVIFMLSGNKMDAIANAAEVTEQLMKQVPDVVDGHLKLVKGL